MEPYPIQSTTSIFQSFNQIDRQSYHTIIRYFNQHVEEIKCLNFEEYFEILTSYVNALFEAGAYQKHALMADVVIEASIINNVRVYQGIALFEKTLFQKAASLYHLHQFEESAHILTELIKINPSDETFQTFLRKNRLLVKPAYLRKSLGLAIVFYFISILVIALTTFFLDPFYPQYTPLADQCRNLAFMSGTGLILITDGIHRLGVLMQVRKLTAQSIEKLKRS